MTAPSRRWAAELLHLWFHRLRPADWWGGSANLDSLLRRRFAHDLASLGRRPAREFLTDPLTARAAILLFDQVPRNIHRGTAAAFAWDPLARQLTHAMVRRGWDESVPQRERQFVYMPLMHSEAIADQRRSLQLFAARARDLAYARSHHKMIARFGRFPHRNKVLGRKSSAAEKRAIAEGYAW